MAWTNKTKVSSTFERGKILSPASDQILVGEDEDLVLIYQTQHDLYTNKVKTSSSWTNKTKIL